MTLTEIISEMRLEIQESAESVFLDTELTRAVQKTVSLMSRLIPKKAVKEKTIVIDVTAESVTLPAAASATHITNAITLNGETDGATLSIASQIPDVARRLTVTLTDANKSVTQLTMKVKGYDENNLYIEELWTMPQLRGGTAVQGDLYFKYVTQVEVEHIGSGANAADLISVGTGNAYDSDVLLANKGIKWNSETVTSSPAGTTYVRDTDYRINYLTGGIRYINGGSMAAGGTYLVTYKLDSHILDMGSLLPKEAYIKLERVEYPVGDDPPTFPTFDPLGEDLLLVKSKDTPLTGGYHIRVHYLKPWTAPGSDSNGDYPEHLNNAIIIGAVGQVLIFKAETYVQSAIDALSALTAPTLHVFTNPTPPTLPTAPTATSLPGTPPDFTAASAALTAISTEITAAKAHHTAGIVLINVPTGGERVASTYGEYANALVQASAVRVNEAIATLRAEEGIVSYYANQVAAYGSEVNSYANEMSGTVGKYREQIGGEGAGVASNNAMIAKFIAQANEQEMKARNFLEIAGRYLASGQSKINEFLAMLGVKPELIQSKSSSEQRS